MNADAFIKGIYYIRGNIRELVTLEEICCQLIIVIVTFYIVFFFFLALIS